MNKDQKNPAVEMPENPLFSEENEATYCPEDNKLRLYVGRVPWPEFEALRAQGWTSTPKQDCDFVATWTPAREDMALAYAGIIGDEDQSPADRAADRAERFAGYRDKRTSEALTHADSYDSGPSAHGYQSKARATRAADRHDRQASRALTQWDKAEYWTRRTEGVISNALYRDRADVRLRRIKKIEAEKRKQEKYLSEYRKNFALVRDIQAGTVPEAFKKHAQSHYPDKDERTALALYVFGGISSGYYYKHPRAATHPREYIREKKTSLYSLLTDEADPITGDEAVSLWLEDREDPESEAFQFSNSSARWVRHEENRIAYEKQMLDAQGGRLEMEELTPGGYLRGHRIHQVNKSPATGRAVSVKIWGTFRTWKRGNLENVEGLHTVKLDSFKPEDYQAPTAEDLEAFKAEKKTLRDKIKAKAPKKAPLVNPTPEEAERLQALWNGNRDKRRDAHGKPAPEVVVMDQATYSANSKGSSPACRTVDFMAGGRRFLASYNTTAADRAREIVVKVRMFGDRVVILEDKPQKAFPAALWADPRIAQREALEPEAGALVEAMRKFQGFQRDNRPTDEDRALIDRAELAGLVRKSSHTQAEWTDTGAAWVEQHAPKTKA